MQIFLSYASDDRSYAEEIVLSLLNDGHRVFFDKNSLQVGRDFNRRIHEEIEKSELLIFLISPQSIEKNRFTLTELKFFRAKWDSPDGRVLPVLLKEVSRKAIPEYLRAVTILEPEGNIAAEVAAEVHKLGVPLPYHSTRQFILPRRLILSLGTLASISLLVYTALTVSPDRDNPIEFPVGMVDPPRPAGNDTLRPPENNNPGSAKLLRSKYVRNFSTKNSDALKEVAVFVISSSKQVDNEVNILLSNSLTTSEVAAIPSVFTTAFISDGLYDELFYGASIGVLEEWELDKTFDYILLVQKEASSEKRFNKTLGVELEVSRVKLLYKLISLTDSKYFAPGEITSEPRSSQRSREEAEAAAFDLAAKKLVTHISQLI